MQRLQQRRDFLAAAKSPSWSTPGAVLQARARDDIMPPRIGFTVTKKIGNAVTRNRVKRRLREAARLALPDVVRSGFDYVLIGRQTTAARPFEALKQDLVAALTRLHRAPHERDRQG